MSLKILTDDCIKSKKVSGNTGSGATLYVDIDSSQYVIIGVKCNYDTMFFASGGTYRLQPCEYMALGNGMYGIGAVANTDIEATVYYVKK